MELYPLSTSSAEDDEDCEVMSWDRDMFLACLGGVVPSKNSSSVFGLRIFLRRLRVGAEDADMVVEAGVVQTGVCVRFRAFAV